ncbi:hypothetical protein Droror1_Dr00021531 [Drosera rotundifolia]
MIPTCAADSLTNTRLITPNSLVIIYTSPTTLKPITITPTGTFQNRFGLFRHSDFIGRPFGSKVYSSDDRRGYIYLLAPTPELWSMVLSHRTQILYLADVSLVVFWLEVGFGGTVLESGTGSGAMTVALARAVGGEGRVLTFDFHEGRAQAAREDFERIGVSSIVTVGARDIQGQGFPPELAGQADAVFLDLPQPWLAIPSAGEMLKVDAVLCSFSPCIEQVQRSCETLKSKFTDIRTFEVLLRTYEVKEVITASGLSEDGCSMRPCKRRQRPSGGTNASESPIPSTIMAKPSAEARGHTGYLTFARRKCLY